MRWRTSSRILPATSVCAGESCRLSKKVWAAAMVRALVSQMFWLLMQDGAGFGAEALASAVGAEGVAAVFGEEDADVELVFFALERGEEAADAGEFVVAFFDEALLVVGEIVPGDVGGDVGGFGGADHLAVVGAVFGGAPGGDGAVGEGLGFVGDDEVGVEVDGVAEALAAGAGAVGVVEGEEAGFGLAVGAVAGGALEGGGEADFAAFSFWTALGRGTMWNWTSPDSR